MQSAVIFDTGDNGPSRIKYADGIKRITYEFVDGQAIGRPTYRGVLGLIFGFVRVGRWAIRRMGIVRNREANRRTRTGGNS